MFKKVFVAGVVAVMSYGAANADVASTNYVDTTTVRRGTSVTGVGSATVPVYVDTNGTAQAITEYSGTAAQATADGAGNNIADTYAKKADLSFTEANNTSAGNGYIKTVTQTDGKIAVTRETGVKIPSGSATAAPTVSIWVAAE